MKYLFCRRKHYPTFHDVDEKNFLENFFESSEQRNASCIKHFMTRISTMISKDDRDEDLAYVMRAIAHELSNPFGGRCIVSKNKFDERVIHIGPVLNMMNILVH